METRITRPSGCHRYCTFKIKLSITKDSVLVDKAMQNNTDHDLNTVLKACNIYNLS